MQVIQLYIQGSRVDMFKDESVSITDTIKNVKDVSKIFTEFSKTFSLPASKENNKLFKHFYNFDIVGGFDARVRVSASIELNHLPFKKGFVKLEGVNLKNNKAHTYKITFFGNTVSLKEKFGDDKLQSLDWLDNFSYKNNGDALTYTSDTIRDYLQNNRNKTVDSVTYTNAVQVPLLTHTQRLFYKSGSHAVDSGNIYYHGSSGQYTQGVKFNELKFAIKVPIIVKAIEERYGITFSTDFLNMNNDSYKDLFLWLHRVKGNVTSGGQVTEFEYTVNDWSNTTRVFSSLYSGNFYIDPGADSYDELKLSFTPVSNYNSVQYVVTVFLWGSAIFTSFSGVGFRQFDLTNLIAIGMPYTVTITVGEEMKFSNVAWLLRTRFQQTPVIDQIQTNVNGDFTIEEVFQFQITQQIPEMKVIDFVTGLFKMFNLIAYVDQDTDIIVVKTLDEFYDDATTYDISQFIDVNTSEVNTALPFREVTYTYEGLDTYLSSIHSQLFAKQWGKEEFRNNSNDVYAGGIFNYVIPFEHLKFERLLNLSNSQQTNIQWGFCVDDNQEPYIGKPILFYLNRSSYQLYSFVNEVDSDNVATDHVSNIYHFRPSNSNANVSPFSNQPSLNFFPEVDEYEGTNNTQTLFNKHHKLYISSIFETSKRLSKFTAYLPQRILLNYKLSDRFIVNNQNYKINSITTNLLTGKSQLELLNDNTPVFLTLTNIGPYGNPNFTYYYKYSIQEAFNLQIGDVIYTNASLTSTLSAGTYFQNGTNETTTFCVLYYSGVLVVDSNGVITNKTCGLP